MSVEAAERPQIHWRKVIALVGGNGLSLAGDFVLLVALSWTAVQIGGAGTVTAIMLAETLPRALVLIFGGAIADTLGPRMVLLRTTGARFAVLAIGTVIVLNVHSFWPLLFIAVAEGVLLGLSSPSTGSLMPRLADGDHLARANSLYGTVLRLAPIVGAPIGAALIATGRLWVAMVVVTLTCAAQWGTLLYATKGIERPTVREGDDSLWRRSGDGLRLLRANPRLRLMFVSAFCLDLAFGWPLEVALPLIADQREWGVAAVGIVVSTFGIGALASGVLGAMIAHRIPIMIRLIASGVGIAAGIVLMALMPSVVSLAVASFLVGTMCGLNGPAIVTTYQQAAPKNAMGAAMSTLSLSGAGTGPFSIALFSGLAFVIGVEVTWIVCGVVALIGPIAALLALRHPIADEPAPQVELEAREPALVGAAR
ncbi:MFS transporter [Allorhizocola rhizosphaerae]|uniref:MFS transporter n=1 Tax=Allorhizocola rhizosphaerae TaxID=1872709 RepID=UPI000E3DDCA8|nr:MFS transporter [Allorhizocola rhizosphaerae]